eukprot:COSAG01_NODE_17350_length_1158_cov_1.640227_1_plen_66_part_00
MEAPPPSYCIEDLLEWVRINKNRKNFFWQSVRCVVVTKPDKTKEKNYDDEYGNCTILRRQRRSLQ